MATVNSDQFANTVAVPQINLDPRDLKGRLRVAYATWTTSSPAQNDRVNLFTLPAGARILTGKAAFEAMGAGAKLDVGVLALITKYANTVDVAAAGQADFANTIALLVGDILASDTIIQARMAGAAWANGAKAAVQMFWVID
jgi:hypothetical protein